MDVPSTLGVLLWGTLVGLDLASVAQIMIARPIVAGTVAGWIVGDVHNGLVLGTLLELCALELLPFGASRYPDYGLGAVAAAATAAGAPDVFGIGVGAFVGLFVAYLGEHGTQWMRRRTTEHVRRWEDAIDAGDVRIIRRVHAAGIGRDALRAATITGIGLVLALGSRAAQPSTVRAAVLLGAVAIGVGLGSTAASGWRIGRSRPGGWVWLVIGAIGGALWVVAR